MRSIKILFIVSIVMVYTNSIFASISGGCDPEIFMVNSPNINDFEKNNYENSIEIMNSTEKIDIILINQEKQKDFYLQPLIDNVYNQNN